MLLASPELNQTAIEDCLREILESQFFRSTAQCSALFRYIVENTLLERDECLRERVIGAKVFDRPHDYDTGNDHVVRSRASEVRKRLAQFYQENDSYTGIRISIPTGSYRATFDLMPAHEHAVQSFEESFPTSPPSLSVEPSPLSLPAERKHSNSRARGFLAGHWRLCASVAILLCAATGWGVHRYLAARQNGFNAFWAPMLQNPKPVLIYCGGGFVYKLSDQYLDGYRQTHQLKDTRREFFVDLKKGEPLDGADLVPNRHFVPFGDLASTASLVANLTNFHKAYDLRYGEDVAFTEFRTSPVILIGGLNNSWALRVTRNLRYVLDGDDRIVDRWHPERHWEQKSDADSLTRDDYAIVSRLPQAEAGGFVLSVAGIRMYGTQAAADLISDKDSMNRLLKDAPKDWAHKNMQIVLHTRVVNEIPVSVDIVATNYW